MAKIEFSRTSLRDLSSIHEYISKDAESYADNVINNIIKRVKVLEKHTYIGKVVPEFTNSLIRELIEGNYTELFTK